MKFKDWWEKIPNLIKGCVFGIILNLIIGMLSITLFFNIFGEKVGFVFAYIYYALPNLIFLKNCSGEDCLGSAILLSILWIIITGAILGIIIELIIKKIKSR